MESEASSSSNAAPAPAVTAEETPRLRVALSLMGREFSRSFMLSLITTMYSLWESQKVRVILSPGYDVDSTHQRMRAWGIPPHHGARRLPLDGEFDVFVSIGPDVVFQAEQLIELVECAMRNHPVIAGMVRGPTVDHVQVADQLDVDDLAKNETWTFWKVEKIQKLQEALQKKQEAKEAIKAEEVFHKVAFASLDFMAVRRDVFENAVLMEQPLFYLPPLSYTKKVVKGDAEPVEVSAQYVWTDEEAFCMNLQRAEIPLHVHTGILVGLEKPVLL